MIPVTKSIIELFNELNISKAQFIRDLNVAKQTIENIFLENNLPGTKVIYRILEAYPWVNPAWLITNEGSMRKDSEGFSSAALEALREKERVIEDLRRLTKTQDLAIDLLKKTHK